jgi:hypothetical protein
MYLCLGVAKSLQSHRNATTTFLSLGSFANIAVPSMNDLKEPRVYTHQLPSQSTIGHNTRSANLWPSHPQTLKESALSKWINIMFDIALCIAPLILIAKIGLVIWAGKQDKDKIPAVWARPSEVTMRLTQFNDQVSNKQLFEEHTNSSSRSLAHCTQLFS